MNCLIEKIAILFVLMVTVIASPNHRNSRQTVDLNDRQRPNRPSDGGQLPNPTPPNFPDQNQGPRPTDENIPNEGGVIFKPPCNCPTVANYNPVCGNNNKTYANPSVLNCHNRCGVEVEMVKLGSCGSNRS